MPKIILITGASSGLGASMAAHLFNRGHIVYAVSRSLPVATPSYHTMPMDVSNMQQIQQAVAAIIAEQGCIDVLINNAGLGLASPAEHLDMAHVARLMDTNLLGPLRVCQAVLPHMRRQGSGLIINISSIASENGLPYRGAYSASKAALDRLTESLRIELAPYGIQACVVQPGAFHTDANRHRMTVALPPDSAYATSFERSYKAIHRSIDKGSDPETLGPLIERILHTGRVKRCYRIGSPKEKLSVLMKRIFPDHFFDRLMGQHWQV